MVVCKETWWTHLMAWNVTRNSERIMQEGTETKHSKKVDGYMTC